MAHTRSLLTFMSAAMIAGPAWAEQAKIDGFLTDPVEVYDQNEEYVDDYDVGGIDAAAVKVLDVNGDMVKLDFAGQHEPAWVFKTDVKSEAGCREAAGGKVSKAKNASTMGLDGDLCE